MSAPGDRDEWDPDLDGLTWREVAAIVALAAVVLATLYALLGALV